MHIITKKALTDFSAANAQAKEELSIWYQQVKAADWKDFNAIRADFPSCDYVGDNRYIFNIKGNHYRLIAMIFFVSKQVFIRGIFTHAQYDKLTKKHIVTL
ncbi:type II toxin-antitoxin system HigB family toxin [Hymenobacter sp. HSC-4F20]|uniref:type II toxin-antitoxin system HigB family toxin n=1 Tax=Hymenobacter sp. HSC-4F20 TaxID=2864135 RepID=UPI001C72C2A4|nr:type II toxin-antitoxin system HigB family toxin [Hymenobacter sp. HSC-4F20]MBX0290097.1 type II toxin-antitoxin system HigB family toxin [Hymenobacter sp. HSC-4F20]